jgi:Spy/CpxP family protein refolding chaperone
MKSKWLTSILILSLAVNAAAIGTIGYHSFLSPANFSTAPCFPAGDGHLYQSLNLSQEQMDKMEPLARAFHRRMAEMKASMEGKRLLLVDLLQKQADPGTIDALRKEMASIQDMIQKDVIAHIGDVRGILNPGQQEQFFELLRRSMTSSAAASSLAPRIGGNQ